jgi:neutral amino acid transport system permease protein
MINYIVFLTISTAIYALFSLGLNLQWGFSGLINFGHVAFMTVGAYTTVLLTTKGIPILLAVPLGCILAAFLGFLIGLSTLRLREDYLGIVTIGVSELIRLVANNEEWLTKGTFGVQDYALPLSSLQPNLFGKIILVFTLTVIFAVSLWKSWLWFKNNQQKTIPALIFSFLGIAFLTTVYICGAISLFNYTDKSGLMLLSLLVLALVYWMLQRLIKSPWGRILKAIREDEQIPKALGKNVFWYKLQAFMLGGAIGGLSGSFFAWNLQNVYPSNFEPLITFNAWTIVVLGGAGNNLGTIIGAVIFWGYDTLTRLDAFKAIAHLDDARLGAFRVMIIGLILIVLMMVRPEGMLGKKEELTLGK